MVGNDLKTISPMLFTTKSKIHSAPTIIGTKLSTPKNEVHEVFYRMSTAVIGDYHGHHHHPLLASSLIPT